ncbi:DinB family protein [Mucilaginibacter boryungensis]|uniref:DinB family protein n=1 Tax=Mucilaginibacter boryungensis TaxID=768480 RepID=A0ABR9XLV5_9SPHI|nr:DinB family protein [Mucilaginibacter boryungensis]MBE9667933.1 DinB family protein [Mucilaginibacter boryungensis]
MKITDERKRTEAVLDIYRSKVDTIPDNVWDRTPPGGGWSFAEVYSHIMQGTLLSTKAAERCTQSNCRPTNNKMNLLGRFTLFFGTFPPVKLKEPARVAEKMPALKITKEEARNMIIKCRQRLEAIIPLILNPENHGRIAHPRMGMMTAGQWLKFIRIHLQHHLKQIKRIENKFSI